MATAFFRRGNSDELPLHSRYDPLKEARQSLKELDLADANFITLLGFGLGYGLDALLESGPAKDAHIFVVESDLEILRAAFMARDLTPLLSVPHIHFAWPATGNALAEQWRLFFDPVQARQSVFINHPPSLLIDPELFKAAAEVIRSKTLQIFTDINTLVGRIPTFLDNFIANFPAACNAPGAIEFRRRFAGMPAILVSAGPSLDRNLHELRPFQDSILILATDTTLRPLLAAGIHPHFVLTGDPGPENYLHLKGTAAHKTCLVAEATTFPDSLKIFSGRTLICKFENSSLQALADLLASKGTLRAWGSVATMCLDFALQLGCNPIIFIGQDLAHSQERTYCCGLHWDDRRFEGVANPEQWARKWAEVRSHTKAVTTTDLFGNPVESTEKLLSYWNWIEAEIEKRPDVRFINATEGGILKRGLDIMSLREALYRYHKPGHDFRGEIQQTYALAQSNPWKADVALLSRLQSESQKLKGILQKGLTLCREPAPPSIRDFSAKLEEVKQSIYALRTLAPLLDSFNQMGNFHFLRRQAAHSGQNMDRSEIQTTFLEYFQSVSLAAERLNAGLSRLAAAIPPLSNPLSS
jgi:hypothetical protein